MTPSKPRSPKLSEQESQAQITRHFSKAKGRISTSSSPTNNTKGNKSPTPTTNLQLLYPERSSAPVPVDSEKHVQTTDSHDVTESIAKQKRKLPEIFMGIFRDLTE